uniref:Vipericidin n=1 Tax=Laticauda laticaudata TaxID=8630 RepID=A0A8C5SXS5_LATLA
MTTAWAVLLLLGLATAAPRSRVLTYQQAIASAIDLYNQQVFSEFAFRLLEAEPQPDWDPNSKTPLGLKFSIKETVCPSSQQSQNLTQCNFREDGVSSSRPSSLAGSPSRFPGGFGGAGQALLFWLLWGFPARRSPLRSVAATDQEGREKPCVSAPVKVSLSILSMICLSVYPSLCFFISASLPPFHSISPPSPPHTLGAFPRRTAGFVILDSCMGRQGAGLDALHTTL